MFKAKGPIILGKFYIQCDSAHCARVCVYVCLCGVFW